jgi:hypothetical protein
MNKVASTSQEYLATNQKDGPVGPSIVLEMSPIQCSGSGGSQSRQRQSFNPTSLTSSQEDQRPRPLLPEEAWTNCYPATIKAHEHVFSQYW